jgi:hypothetical protein
VSEKPASQQIGIVTVSMDLLAELLHFPEGHKIVDVRRGDRGFDEFQILCEGPTLPVSTFAEYTPSVQYLVNVTETEELERRRTYSGTFELINDRFSPGTDPLATAETAVP